MASPSARSRAAALVVQVRWFDLEPLVRQRVRVSLARRGSIYYYPMEKRVSLYTLIGAAIRPRGTNIEVGLTFYYSYIVQH